MRNPYAQQSSICKFIPQGPYHAELENVLERNEGAPAGPCFCLQLRVLGPSERGKLLEGRFYLHNPDEKKRRAAIKAFESLLVATGADPDGWTWEHCYGKAIRILVLDTVYKGGMFSRIADYSAIPPFSVPLPLPSFQKPRGERDGEGKIITLESLLNKKSH